jgi:hypothetical protein
MADSKRLHILKLMTAFLEQITVANGYEHDLTARVSRGLNFVSAETPLPWVNIIENLNPDRDPLEVGESLQQQDDWILLVQGWVETDEEDLYPTDKAHALMADVKRRLSRIIDPGSPQERNPEFMLGDVIEGFVCEPGVVRPADETSSTAFFYLRVVVKLVEHLDDPSRLD